MSLTKKNIYASTPVVTRGKPVLLGGDPKGKNFLYCCGNTVVIRNLDNPLIAELYSEHAKECTVARYAPSGFYIASGDVSGKVRIWDTTQAEHPLKIELQLLSGTVLDLDWSEDSKRICAVGEGKEKYGAVVQFDTGASTGEVTGHSKAITSCHFKPNRPYRLATGSEDFAVNWFEGPPFKFKKSLDSGHSRFVNCVRFNPQGTLLVSVGLDKRGVLFDAKEGAKVGELAGEKEGGHGGGIYACSWAADGARLLTASADKTAKIWDVQTGKCVTTFKFGAATEDQQLGCLWQGQHLLSMSLTGDLAYLDPNNPDRPIRIIKGHNKFITALAYDPSAQALFTGSYDGLINRWSLETGAATQFGGKGHTNAISGLAVRGNELVSASWDDSVRITPIAPGAYSAGSYGAEKVATQGQPADLAVQGGLAAVATVSAVQLLRNGKVVSTTPAKEASAVAISPDGRTVVVGQKDAKLLLFAVEGDTLRPQGTLDAHRGSITRIAFAPNGSQWASADTNREILVWDVGGKDPRIRGWVFHSARVNDIAWSPDNVHLASVSLDQSIIIWNASKPEVRIQQKQAHQTGVNAVRWINETTIVTVGQDCTAKTWQVTY